MKKLVKILIGAVCAIVLALIIVPFFIPAETYKNALIAQVRKMTGRELTIAGNASLRLLPNVALNVEDVTLSNPAGFADKDLTHIGKLSVDVALKPLFDKRVEMRGATLEDAVIALEEREDGIKSWELMPAVKGTETDASPKEKSAKKDMSKIILGSVSIKNSKMIYRKAGKPPIELSDINLTVDSQGFASKLTADLEAVYKGEKIAIDATVENPEQFLNAKATALEVTAKAPATEVSFKGEGAMGDALVAMGNLSASVSDLPKLTGWATGKPSGAKPKSINAKGRFATKANRYELLDATLDVDGIAAKGNIAVTMGGAVPLVEGTLAFGTLNINELTGGAAKAEASTAPAEGKAAKAPSQGWSTKPIDVSALRAVDANLGLSAAAVKMDKLELGQTSAKIRLKGGNLHVSDIATALYQGTAKGNLRVDGASGSPAIGADMDISNVQIEPLMIALAGKSRLAGTANLSLNVTGAGKHQRAIVSSLNGSGAMKVTDGAIIGINLGKFIREAKQGFLSESTSERTDFAELSGTFAIASGIVSNKDLAMKAPLLRLTGEGSASLPEKTINYRLIPKLAATSKGQGGKEDKAGISIPLIISGPWSKPSITPDVAGIVQEGLKDPEALKQNIKGIGEGLKDYNSKDDLKKALGGVLGGKSEPAPATQGTTTEQPAAPAPAKQKPEDALKSLMKGF